MADKAKASTLKIKQDKNTVDIHSLCTFNELHAYLASIQDENRMDTLTDILLKRNPISGTHTRYPMYIDEKDIAEYFMLIITGKESASVSFDDFEQVLQSLITASKYVCTHTSKIINAKSTTTRVVKHNTDTIHKRLYSSNTQEYYKYGLSGNGAYCSKIKAMFFESSFILNEKQLYVVDIILNIEQYLPFFDTFKYKDTLLEAFSKMRNNILSQNEPLEQKTAHTVAQTYFPINPDKSEYILLTAIPAFSVLNAILNSKIMFKSEIGTSFKDDGDIKIESRIETQSKSISNAANVGYNATGETGILTLLQNTPFFVNDKKEKSVEQLLSYCDTLIKQYISRKESIPTYCEDNINEFVQMFIIEQMSHFADIKDNIQEYIVLIENSRINVIEKEYLLKNNTTQEIFSYFYEKLYFLLKFKILTLNKKINALNQEGYEKALAKYEDALKNQLNVYFY